LGVIYKALREIARLCHFMSYNFSSFLEITPRAPCVSDFVSDAGLDVSDSPVRMNYPIRDCDPQLDTSECSHAQARPGRSRQLPV